MELNDTQLRMFAVEVGTRIYMHNSELYQDDEEMVGLIGTPVEIAEEIYAFLKGE